MTNRPKCPRCNGLQVYKNGSNSLKDGSTIQRWFCQNCRKTFQPANSAVQETPESFSETSAARPKHGC